MGLLAGYFTGGEGGGKEWGYWQGSLHTPLGVKEEGGRGVTGENVKFIKILYQNPNVHDKF